MINVAIVEDKREETDTLISFLTRFSQESAEQFNISVFTSALIFLAEYKANYDVVFMDIMFPDLNGMEAAKRLRKTDRRVPLIFVTNMSQYAVRGYEVNAYDFIVKPVVYSNFSLKLKRVIDYIYENRGTNIQIPQENGCLCINIQDIKYVEVIAHKITYHTIRGNYTVRDTLKNVAKSLEMGSFARCNSCYLVNLYHVTAVKNFTCYLGKEELVISHPKRKEFIRALNDYFGGGHGM